MNSNIPSVGSQTQSKRNAFCFGQRLTSKRSLFITCSKEMMFERNDVWTILDMRINYLSYLTATGVIYALSFKLFGFIIGLPYHCHFLFKVISKHISKTGLISILVPIFIFISSFRKFLIFPFLVFNPILILEKDRKWGLGIKSLVINKS